MYSIANENGTVFITHAGVAALGKQTIRIEYNSKTIDPRMI